MGEFPFYTIVIIVAVVLVSGAVISIAYSMAESKQNYWKETPLEKLSCEIFADYLGGYGTTLANGDKRVLTVIIEERWIEADCKNVESENWKGEDWKYVKTNSDIIAEVEEKMND